MVGCVVQPASRRRSPRGAGGHDFVDAVTID